ncbi:MAG: transglycosylase domain-containing protein [Acidobacteria bacterium]|nr:transglycosylase domain-containing protein [Acidobacteriota bacterium]
MKVIIRIHTGRLLKSTLALLLCVLLVSGGVFIFFYRHYSQRIDRAIRERPWEVFPSIYSAPSILFPGQAMSYDDLVQTLERRGYKLSSFLEDPPAYKPIPDQQTILVVNDFDWSPRPHGTPLRGRIRFDDDQVAAVTELQTGQPLARFAIRPARLSAQRSGESRIQVLYDQLPPNLVYAVLAAEDQRFFDHPGLDLPGIIRSFVRNLQAEQVVEGGSTITQQLAKNLFLTPEKTLRRKLEEAFISLILETRLGKKELFELYANQVYLGQTASLSIYGLGQAAAIYCGKDIRNLNLPECALLAGLIRSPNPLHPFRHPQLALERRNLILEAMESAGYILPDEAMIAAAAPLPQPQADVFDDLPPAPYFLDYLATDIRRLLATGAIRPTDDVHSSLNLELQLAAEEAMTAGYGQIVHQLARDYPAEPAADLQLAVVVLAPATGQILAMTGGRDYRVSQFNRAVFAHRQAGSILKPLIYMFLIEKGAENPDLGLTAATVVDDRPVTIRYGRRSYRPHNYRNRYAGPVIMETALARSLNSATVQLAERVGFPSVARYLDRFTFARPATPYPSVALGTLDVTPLEIATAYTIFLNEGRLKPSHPWSPLSLPAGIPASTTRPLSSPQAAFITLDMMQAVVNRGTARRLRDLAPSLTLAGKTGTAHDGWFVGLCDNLICCIWVGYDQNRDFPLSGGESALLVFAEFLERAQQVYPVVPLQPRPPAGLTRCRVCLRSGELADSACPETEELYFFTGTEPHRSCQTHH